MRRSGHAGFSLIELLTTVAMVATVVAGSALVLYNHNRRHLHEELSVSMEENLRIAATIVTNVLRNAGYGLPGSSLASWVPWVSGFDQNPKIVSGGLAPDRLSIGLCTDEPVARLAAPALPGATTLLLDDASALDTASRRLVWIGESEHAHVRAVVTNLVTIDTQPAQSNNQGLSRGFVAGTPLCRVDVVTFDVANDPSTGVPQLRRDDHQGLGPRNAVDGIRGLDLLALADGRYRVLLEAQTPTRSPQGGALLTRSLGAQVTLANGS